MACATRLVCRLLDIVLLPKGAPSGSNGVSIMHGRSHHRDAHPPAVGAAESASSDSSSSSSAAAAAVALTHPGSAGSADADALPLAIDVADVRSPSYTGSGLLPHIHAGIEKVWLVFEYVRYDLKAVIQGASYWAQLQAGGGKKPVAPAATSEPSGRPPKPSTFPVCAPPWAADDYQRQQRAAAGVDKENVAPAGLGSASKSLLLSAAAATGHPAAGAFLTSPVPHPSSSSAAVGGVGTGAASPAAAGESAADLLDGRTSRPAMSDAVLRVSARRHA